MFSIIWMFFMLFFLLCGIVGGIFLIVMGIKYWKLFVGLMGLFSLFFVILFFVFLSVGIYIDIIFLILIVFYWILFFLIGLLVGVSGV